TGTAVTDLPVMHVQVKGDVVADARATPAVVLRTVELGDAFEDTVLISSRTGVDITVVDAAVEDGAPFSLVRIPDGSSKSATLFRVTGARFPAGLHEAELRFVVSHKGNGHSAPITLYV